MGPAHASVEGPDGPRARLEELRAATEGRTRSLLASFDSIVEAASDVATDDEHDPEGHTIAWERQQVAALLRDARAELAEIDAALARLDDGAYGQCTACGDRIGVARLDALPATSTCIRCAR
ncbi:MAG: TraR/DksA family transcriptional regulator [Actinomycetota bacterium]|nr:TraR/DksA family transcriptional regulator [Actinomycetota bacterium]